jgi:hypothetical protein
VELQEKAETGSQAATAQQANEEVFGDVFAM